MRILIFGSTGMLGHKLVQMLGAKFDVWATIKSDFPEVERFDIFARDRAVERVDVSDVVSVRSAIETAKPDVVINAVGIIKQLQPLEDAVQTLAINSVFPHLLAALSREYGFRLITVSTDCVFNGEKGNYTETDLPNARDLYGISKFLGEVKYDNCLTIRTSIIGEELAANHSLVEWFLSNRGQTVRGYVNAIYSGFPTNVLAEILSGIIADHPQLHGVYHVSSDSISKFELLRLLNEYYQANVTIEAYEEFVIDRSLDSSAFRRATGFEPRGWREMIEQMAADSTPYEKWRN